MALKVSIVIAIALLVGLAGLAVGYIIHPSTTVYLAESVVLSGKGFSCGPSSQVPYLEGVLQFNLTSTYKTDVVASVAYTGSWTGDTNQLVHPNATKHVEVTWGPGKMQNIQVTECPSVGVVIW